MMKDNAACSFRLTRSGTGRLWPHPALHRSSGQAHRQTGIGESSH